MTTHAKATSGSAGSTAEGAPRSPDTDHPVSVHNPPGPVTVEQPVHHRSHPKATPGREVLIRCVYRTGVQTVEREGDRYFLTLQNRTNDTCHEVPIEAARRYYRKMRDDNARQGHL